MPNLLSGLRIILTVPIVYALTKEYFLFTLILFAFSAFTDALDGFIAKRFNCQTALGAVLDPLADKFLLISCFFALLYLGLMPLWLVAIVLVRDVVLIAGAVGYYHEVGLQSDSAITPSNLSKLNTFLQIAAVFLTIVAQLYPVINQGLAVLYIIVATSTLLSGIDYAWAWIKRVLTKT